MDKRIDNGWMADMNFGGSELLMDPMNELPLFVSTVFRWKVNETTRTGHAFTIQRLIIRNIRKKPAVI